MRGHPVFIAQHATGTCCRGCLQKWHNIPKGKTLNALHIEHMVDVICCWLRREVNKQQQQPQQLQ